MTAQLRNHETMQKRTANPDFMVRWLNGDLTEAELASLRNRKEYEEMVLGDQSADVSALPQKELRQAMVPVFPQKENVAVVETANTNSFATFVAIAIVALLATLLVIKSSGWF